MGIFKDIRFRSQLGIVFSAGVFILAVTTTIVISRLSSNAMHERIVSEGISLTEALAEQSTLALLYGSDVNAAESASIFLAFPDVVGVQVFNPDFSNLHQQGEIVSSELEDANLSSEASLLSESSQLWEFFSPVYASATNDDDVEFYEEEENVTQEIIGYVKIIHSKDALKKMTANILFYNLVLSSIISGALLLLLLAITRQITNPIQRLALTMRQAEDGERNQRADLVGPPDIVEMQSAFNTMMHKLESREEELKAARDQAVELAREKGEFAANVSHELRTPMNGVLGMLEILSDLGLSEKQEVHLGTAKKSAQSLLGLIDDVLDFSKNDAGKTVIEPRLFNLEDELNDIIALLTAAAQKKRIDLTYYISAELPEMVIGDNLRIRQILINLAGNALKFTQEGSVDINVSILAHNDGKIRVRFDVRDTGIGITGEQQRRIFTAFSQADGSTTRKFGGTGLGLSISRQFVELMDGEMGVESELGVGSNFWFELNLGQSDVKSDGVPIKPHLCANKRVLFVDSNELVLRSLERFAASKSILCDVANSYNSAVNLLELSLKKEKFDIVVVDELLDGAGGVSLARLVHTISGNKSTKVVMMAHRSISSGEEREESVELYLAKPVTSAQFSLGLNGLYETTKSLNRSTVAKAKTLIKGKPFKGKKLLLVEDNSTNQQVALGLLEPFGCQVDLAENGRLGLEKIKANKYDLIFMDCYMPEMDGYEAARQVRSCGIDTPIVAITANVMAGEIDKCLDAGMSDYLPKPLDRESLNVKLSNWFGKEKGTSSVATAKPLTEQSGISKPNEATADRELDSSETQSKHSQLAAIDEAALSDLADLLGARFDMVIETFVKDLQVNLTALASAIGDKDSQLVRRLAHTIKGSAANFGALRLVVVSQDLEDSANDGVLDDAPEKLSAIQMESDVVLKFLSQKNA